VTRAAWMVWRVGVSVLLLIAASRSFVLALAYWWAAGGPPTPNPEEYASSGNTFFAVACLCLASAASHITDVARDMRRGHGRA
jgi:hypothetical protein